MKVFKNFHLLIRYRLPQSSINKLSLSDNSSSCSIKTNMEILEQSNYRSTRDLRFSRLVDIEIPHDNWQSIFSSIISNSPHDSIAYRLPNLLLRNFQKNKKMNLRHSLIEFLVKDDRYLNPRIILSLLLHRSIVNAYFDELIETYERTVNETDYEALFGDYIAYLLKRPNHRSRALAIIRSRQPTLGNLSQIIHSSPMGESFSDIRDFIGDYLRLADCIPSSMINLLVKKLSNSFSIDNVRDFFELCNNKAINFTLENVLQLEQILSGQKEVRFKISNIDGLICKHCSNKLSKVELEGEKCNRLADVLMADVMQIQSTEKLYQNSSPRSLQNFRYFFMHCDLPFDCVIDFPNLFHDTIAFKKISEEMLILEIISYVNQLISEIPHLRNFCFYGKKFVFMKNMKGFERKFNEEFSKISKYTDRKFTFEFTDTFTKDDVFILYLALKSGSQCYILTNDAFRDHRALVSDEQSRNYFKKWQSARQILFKVSFGKLKYMIPSQVQPVVSCNWQRGVCHIPFIGNTDLKYSYYPIYKWACLKIE